MHSEWSVPGSEVPVRQGDLVISRRPKSGEIQELCLVITADCDIDKGKFGKQLACLRVTPLCAYIRSVWAEKQLQRAMSNERKKVWEQMVRWHTALLGEKSTLSVEAAENWIVRDSAEAICSALNIPEREQRKVRASISSYRSAIDNLAEVSEYDSHGKYVAFQSAIEGRDCSQDIAKKAQENFKSSLPEDVFLLPSLPQLEIGAAVVLLREIVAVAFDKVCYRAEEASDENLFLRIGRLQPTFKYAVSQAFGTLYSKIGLPKDYEEKRDNALNSIADSIRGSHA